MACKDWTGEGAMVNDEQAGSIFYGRESMKEERDLLGLVSRRHEGPSSGRPARSGLI